MVVESSLGSFQKVRLKCGIDGIGRRLQGTYQKRDDCSAGSSVSKLGTAGAGSTLTASCVQIVMHNK